MICAPIPEVTRSIGARLLWRESMLGRLAEQCGADVVLINTVEAPIRPLRVPMVLVLHDVGAAIAPALYGRKAWLRWTADLGRALRGADHVLSVSHASFYDANAVAGLPREKCTVIGSGSQSLAPGAWSPVRENPYVLYAGTAHSHKNLLTLIRALAEPWPIPRPRLDLAGPATEGHLRPLRREIARLGLLADVRLHGFVDRPALADLMTGASAFVFPSLHEGFGMPIVEAQRFGVPVVASDIPAVREAGGGALLLVDSPLDPRAWVAAISEVLSDERLAGHLSRLGRTKCGDHNWNDVGARAYESLCAVLGRPTKQPRRAEGSRRAPVASVRRTNA